jgi:hypothetical protein
MGRLFIGAGFAVILCLASAAPAAAGDLVLNDGLELEDTRLWTETGNVPSYHRGVVEFDVTGNGRASWAYYQHPGDEISGGLEQTINLLAGVTYTVSADICYHNG